VHTYHKRIHSVSADVTVITCEHKEMNLVCPNGRVIEIVYANYGRTVPGTEACNHASSSNLACFEEESLSIVAGECDGETTCTVLASNTVFGNPCGNTFKYLNVTYSCNCEF